MTELTRKLIVIVESPYAASEQHNVAEHTAYARECLRDCLMRGEIPFASHLLYAQPGVLDDTNPSERQLGIKAGLEIGRRCADKTVVYTDLGISLGMKAGINAAKMNLRPVEYRTIRTGPV